MHDTLGIDDGYWIWEFSEFEMHCATIDGKGLTSNERSCVTEQKHSGVSNVADSTKAACWTARAV